MRDENQPVIRLYASSSKKYSMNQNYFPYYDTRIQGNFLYFPSGSTFDLTSGRPWPKTVVQVWDGRGGIRVTPDCKKDQDKDFE